MVMLADLSSLPATTNERPNGRLEQLIPARILALCCSPLCRNHTAVGSPSVTEGNVNNGALRSQTISVVSRPWLEM